MGFDFTINFPLFYAIVDIINKGKGFVKILLSDLTSNNIKNNK